jgi:anionic cell wall polymer biosynthesis LytR-Cps2A-Psr (LCP) family protein
MSIIAINRNTMTDIDVYDEEGNFRGTFVLQICLQHAYGDGMRVSCIRSVDAVSRLFYDIPISGYVALNLDGIPILNDSIGGVTLEILEDIDSANLKTGETVTLSGNQAYSYLRYRDTDEFGSANLRLERQMEYIGAFFKQAKSKVSSSGEVLDIYDSLQDYMVTSLDFSKLANELLEYGLDDSDIYSIKGETTQPGEFEEFHIDEDALYEMILDIFYNEVEE